MTTASDDELIRWSQAGDHDAFGELVRRHQAAALRVATVALGTSTDAVDVGQEAFVKAFVAIGRFRVGERFEPWLFRIVSNTARNYHRSSAQRGRVASRIAQLSAAPEDGPDDVVVHLERRQQVISAMNTLRPEDRLILTYRWYEQLSEAEIAEALGCRRGTVKSRLNRAMQRLRSELEVR